MHETIIGTTRRAALAGLAAAGASGPALAAERCRVRADYAGAALHAPPPPEVFAQAATPATDAFPAERAQALEAAFSDVAARLKTDTLTAAVVRPGGGAWSGVRAAGTPAPDRFFWASAGKAFTAVVVLQLVAEGRLSPDDRLDRWDRDFPNSGLITVDDLLRHTSGLYSFQEDPGLRAKPGWKTPAQALDVARRRPAGFCPGGGWAYSNTGYVLLGRIIEAVDGRSYAASVTARIVEPLGLKQTVVIGPDGVPTDIPRPASGDGGADDLRTPFAAGAIAASAADMIRFWQGLFGGRLIPAEAVRGQFERLYPMFGQTGLFYGRGVMLYDLPGQAAGESELWLGHSGGMPGLKAVVAYSLKRRAWVAVAFLGDGPAEAAANLLLRAAS